MGYDDKISWRVEQRRSQLIRSIIVRSKRNITLYPAGLAVNLSTPGRAYLLI